MVQLNNYLLLSDVSVALQLCTLRFEAFRSRGTRRRVSTFDRFSTTNTNTCLGRAGHVMQPVYLHFSCSTYVLYEHITTVIYILHNDEMQLHIL